MESIHAVPLANAKVTVYVRDPQGRELYAAADIREGQEVFLHNGLMEYGSVFGHGAYLGPDYTADYLHRAARPSRRTSQGLHARAWDSRQPTRFDHSTILNSWPGAGALFGYSALMSSRVSFLNLSSGMSAA